MRVGTDESERAVQCEYSIGSVGLERGAEMPLDGGVL